MRGRRKISRMNKSVDSEMLWLSSEQKCDIAQRELEELRDELVKLRNESQKVLDNHQVNIASVLVSIVVRSFCDLFEHELGFVM